MYIYSACIIITIVPICVYIFTLLYNITVASVKYIIISTTCLVIQVVLISESHLVLFEDYS